jgi:hypothetical protein
MMPLHLLQEHRSTGWHGAGSAVQMLQTSTKVQELKSKDQTSKAVVTFNNSANQDRILAKTGVLYNELFPEIYDTVMSCQEGRCGLPLLIL